MIVHRFPSQFPNKGKYVRWSESWDFAGYIDEPAYAGQMPIAFPEDATRFECFLGGYIKGDCYPVGKMQGGPGGMPRCEHAKP